MSITISKNLFCKPTSLKLLLLVLLLTCLSACDASSSAIQKSSKAQSLIEQLNDPDGPVMVVAHRGCWREAPENSIEALENCVRLGVDIVEVDLRKLSDGTIVVFHDSSLLRMTGDPRMIEDLTLAEVKRLRLKNRDGQDTAFTEAAIPTLEEFLVANDSRLLIDLDFKSDPAAIEATVADILTNHGACPITMVPILAPAGKVPTLAPSLLPCAGFIANLRVPMGKLSRVAKSYRALKPVAIAVRFDDWNYLYEGAGEVITMKTRLWVNTLSSHHAAGLTDQDALSDPDALWGRLIAAGVDMIQTDEPEALMRYLESKGYRPVKAEE